MSELVFRVKAEYESAIACREELKKVEEQLKKVDENTSPEEIARLTENYAKLVGKWENGLSKIGKLGFYAHDAISKIGGIIKGVNKDMKESADTSDSLYSTIQRRLQVEQKITDEFSKQKTAAQAQLDYAKDGLKRNSSKYEELRDKLSEKYNGKAEGFWSEKDQALMARGREAIGNWEEEIRNRETQIEVLSDLIDKSQEKIEEYKAKLSDFELPQLDLKTNIDDLTQQISDGEKKVDELKGKLATLGDELNERSDFQGAKNKMYDYYAEIQDKKKEIDELQQSVDSFSVSCFVSQQQNLEAYASEISEKLKNEEDIIDNLTKQQSGLNEESAMYVKIQNDIDYHNAERERYAQILETTNKSISDTTTLIENETKAQEQRQEKIKSLSTDVEDLTAKYERQKEIVTDVEANTAAISNIKEEIKATNEQIDQTIDKNNTLKDILSEVEKSYEKSNQNANNYYKGFVGSEYEKSTRVYTNESDYNTANELDIKARNLQQQIMSGVSSGSLSADELKALQDELTATQEKFNELDTKARDTATLLGGEMAQKASAMTTRLYEANKAVEDAERTYEDLNRQLEKSKELLTALEENSGDQKTISDAKQKVDELTESLNEEAEAVARAKAEQKDAQDDIDATTGELGEMFDELKSGKGVFADFDKAVSMLPAPLRNVATSIKGVGNAMKVLAKNPLMIALGALVVALQAVWQWFNKSAEGQRAFAKISGYVGGVITRLEEVFVKFGGVVFNVMKKVAKAFSNPIDAIKSLGDKIQNYLFKQVHNLFQAFGSLGTLMRDIFTGNWDKIGKDIENATKKFKELAKESPLGKIAQGVKDVTTETIDWVKETHNVALEAKNIAAEERELGLEIEANREKTLKLQKSMAELQATMRNTNLSKEERKKALDEYKKLVEQQANIQKAFAEKRSSLHQRKLDLDEPDTIEEMQAQAALNNAILEADLSKQRSLTALTRVTNSINKKSSGKSDAQKREEYELLLNEQAQQQAKKIRENGYIIEQARINALKDGTEKTIAQMKLDYQKELDAATEYENELTKEKLKLARQAFYKDPKNKGKTFDLAKVDVSMTTQEKQVSVAKVSDADEKYRQKIESLYKSYETFDEKREKRERDYRSMSELNSEMLLEKTQKLGELYSEIDNIKGDELEKAKNQINVLEQEIDKLEEKGRLIRLNNELQNEEMNAMLDYLKQYGTKAEQNLAITTEYDRKIALERANGNVWAAAGLEQEKEEKLRANELEQVKGQIDWEGIFNNLDRYSGTFLEQIRTKLQEIINDPNIDPENAKVIADSLGKLDSAIVEKTGNTFHWINTYLLEQKRLQEDAERAEKAYNAAVGEEIKAKNELSMQKANIYDMYSSMTGKKIDKPINTQNKADILANSGLDPKSAEYKKLKKALDDLASTEAKVSKSTKKVEDAEKEMQSKREKALQKTADKVAGWLDGVNSNIQKYLGDLPNLLSSIGLGSVGEKVSAGLSGVNDAAGAAADFASGNYIGAAMKGISAIKNFGAALGIGGGNEKEVAQKTEELTKQNEILSDRIADLTEVMNKSIGSKAINVYSKALEAQEKVNKNTMEILKAQMGYHSAHHSNEYYADDAEIRRYNAQAQQAFAVAGVKASTITGLSSIYNLTPEQLKAIKDFAPDLWNYLTTVGKYDKSEYWENVVDQAGKTAELTEQIMETLTTTTEESVFNDFLSQLYQLADGSNEVFRDIEKGWQEMVNKMVINNLVGEDFQEKLKEWRKKLYELNKKKQENKLTDAQYKKELDKLNEEYRGYVKEAQDEINTYREAGIIKSTNASSQTATFNSAQNISYDQADSMVGILTSHSIVLERTSQSVDLLNAKFDQALIPIKEQRDIAADSRDILAGMAIHVEEIRDGVVDTLVPKIKNIDTEITRMRKAVEER